MAINKFTISIPAMGIKRTVSLDVETPVRALLQADTNDLKEGDFGFDTIPDEDVVKTKYKDLKKEYGTIKDYCKSEYIPSWLSIRENKTVTLKLVLKGDVDNYSKISFDKHDDFTFEPENLKGEEFVNITCSKKSPKEETQVLIKADGKVVGALNIFYPNPKKVTIQPYKFLFEDSQKQQLDFYNHSYLQGELDTAFNPALIDVDLEQIAIINLKTIKDFFYENNYVDASNKSNEATYIRKIFKDASLKKDPTGADCVLKRAVMDIWKAISNNGKKLKYSKKDTYTEALARIIKYTKVNKNTTKDYKNVNLILTYLQCKDGSSFVNGFTGNERMGTLNIFRRATANYFIGNLDFTKDVGVVPHEVGHAIALEHTFKEQGQKKRYFKYIFKQGFTHNYMDYINKADGTDGVMLTEVKPSTFAKWQWVQLNASKYVE